MTIVLFDIDGTLIRTGRAGARAMSRAFEDLFGVPDGFDGIPMAGRTDRAILEEGASGAGIELNAGDARRFWSRYVLRLHEALAEPVQPAGVLPGVQALLEAIAASQAAFPALLTGNCEEGARIKLQHFDLWRFFRCGAYGGDAMVRHELFSMAIERAFACGAPAVPSGDIMVVGDTVLDVECAKAAGARSIAVATGPSDSSTLRSAGADVVLEDLRDTAAFMRLL